MPDPDDCITDADALSVVRIIKNSTDEEGIKIIKNLIDKAQEKVIDVIRELKKKKAN